MTAKNDINHASKASARILKEKFELSRFAKLGIKGFISSAVIAKHWDDSSRYVMCLYSTKKDSPPAWYYVRHTGIFQALEYILLRIDAQKKIYPQDRRMNEGGRKYLNEIIDESLSSDMSIQMMVSKAKESEDYTFVFSILFPSFFTKEESPEMWDRICAWVNGQIDEHIRYYRESAREE